MDGRGGYADMDGGTDLRTAGDGDGDFEHISD
jgi:hypothetical protein